jgi:hypothetical protein
MELIMNTTLKVRITFETKIQSTIINMNENRMKNHNVCEIKYLDFNKVNELDAECSFVNTYEKYIKVIKETKFACNTQTKY